MKVVNVMNFVRQCEPRIENFDEKLYEMSRDQLALVKEKNVRATFLLQYDALCDERFVSLFQKEASDAIEYGLWFEVVEPMTSALGMDYRSELGWKWDWHISPGFSVSYTLDERERLIDEAMRKFREVFGSYPKTVGSWLLDTHTVNRLCDRYRVDAVCICRDQINNDAYTLVGGYFNGAYYPSRENVFTPAQSEKYRLPLPVFRLLGPCPLFNYDDRKYVCEETRKFGGCYTLEPAWYSGKTPEVAKALFRAFYENETLDYAYTQIGQENSFADRDLITPTAMQIDHLRSLGDVRFETMGESGRNFKKAFDKTPPSSVVALDSWDGGDLQSAYYSSENYVCDLFRYGRELFFRAFYFFDETVPDRYETEVCDTFDGVYENLPIVDTNRYSGTSKTDIGLTLSKNAGAFTVKKADDGVLLAESGEIKVRFAPDSITVDGANELVYHKFETGDPKDGIALDGDRIRFVYRGFPYALRINAECATDEGDVIRIRGNRVVLTPKSVK